MKNKKILQQQKYNVINNKKEFHNKLLSNKL